MNKIQFVAVAVAEEAQGFIFTVEGLEDLYSIEMQSAFHASSLRRRWHPRQMLQAYEWLRAPPSQCILERPSRNPVESWSLLLTLTKWNEPSSVSPKHEQSSEITADSEPAETSAMAKSAKAFKFRELVTATKNFRLDCLLVLGDGGWTGSTRATVKMAGYIQ